MITARYEPSLFPSDRPAATHLGTSRRGCAPQVPSSSSSTTSLSDNDDIDRFMELAHAALEEANKEEEAKGVLQELMERLVARTGAPLMAGVIAEQLRSQEVIERLAEQSFERQRRRQQYQQQRFPPSSSPKVLLSTRPKRRRASKVTTIPKNPGSALRPLSSPIQPIIPASSPPLSTSSSSSSVSSSSTSSSSSSSIASTSTFKESNNLEDAVTRDHFTLQQPSADLHQTGSDRLLLVSDYIWRLFRLLILASLVALVYHYVCSYPPQFFLLPLM
ncbi:hypothetical protein [Absidia glauca]|uniref:Uncharacterized protein n=1 Tax=Absidia glauca TaxID=4829 RepID=A0A163JE47_ABSGL|nr:hypothetical protein [Absidia glauca]